jgi:saccharopine dehydrogenase-like NADP-dependent oxidoreductase
MKNNIILILGGYGEAGRQIAQYLLKESDVRIILGGRNLEKAQMAARVLNASVSGERVSILQVDAADQPNLEKAFDQVQMVVVASSTSQYTLNVVQAALNSGIDYLDIQYSTSKLEILKSLTEQIRQRGLCFISEGGFHPGLPAAMVRYLAPEFEKLETAHIGSVIKVDWGALQLSQATIEEFVLEMQEFQPVCFINGEWRRDWKNRRTFNFGTVFGKQKCMAMLLEEMKPLPQTYPSLKETGFYVGGFNWFVDNILMLPSMMILGIFGKHALRPISCLLHWGLKKYSRPPFGTQLLLEASGWKAQQFISRQVKIKHADGYVLTALPVVACLLQYLDGSIQKAGLWMQGNVVEPRRFFKDLQRMGVTAEI